VDFDLDGDLDDLYGIPITWKATLTHPVLYSTPSDLTRWLAALINEKLVITSESLAAMFEIPDTSLKDPEGGLYGLGIADCSEILGVEALGHGGSALGYSAAVLYLPDYDTILAWMVNTGESPPELSDEIMAHTWTSLFEILSSNLPLLP